MLMVLDINSIKERILSNIFAFVLDDKSKLWISFDKALPHGVGNKEEQYNTHGEKFGGKWKFFLGMSWVNVVHENECLTFLSQLSVEQPFAL